MATGNLTVRITAAFRELTGRPVAEQRILNQIRAASASHDEYLDRLRQAALIAQAGGVNDDQLLALLHLAAAGELTPTVERLLRQAGIDPRPWPALDELVQHLRTVGRS
jgi:hypothetical protein